MRVAHVAVVVALSGCYAEGESVFITRGETHRYASMKACDEVATARYPGGGPVYSGFECRSIVFGTVSTVVRYHEGSKIEDGSVPQ